MKLGIVSDIHGNAAALQRAFSLLDDVDLWICLGDIINESRFSNETVSLVKERCAHTLRGNHEGVFFSRQGARARALPSVDKSLMRWLGDQPEQKQLIIGGKTLYLVHSTPWAPHREYVYPNSPSFSQLGQYDTDILLYGHTHQPVSQYVGETLVINPGSVGEGRPSMDGYLFSCARLNLESMTSEILDFVL